MSCLRVVNRSRTWISEICRFSFLSNLRCWEWLAVSVCSETLRWFLECLFQRAADMVALRIHFTYFMGCHGFLLSPFATLAGSVEFLLSQFFLSRLSNWFTYTFIYFYKSLLAKGLWTTESTASLSLAWALTPCPPGVHKLDCLPNGESLTTPGTD